MRLKRIFNPAVVLGLFLFCQAAFAQGVTGAMTGRVTNESGGGVSRAQVSIYPVGLCIGWDGASAMTSSFGYFNAEVRYDCGIVVIPSKKSYVFTPDSLLFTFYSGEEINFVGDSE